MPELRQLRAFVAVAEQLSFTRAAETPGLTQQPVSKSIRDLEAEVGAELFERTTREVRLTDAGMALLEPSRETLRQLEAALDSARAVGQGLLGTLRIAVTPSIGYEDTTDIAQAVRSQAKDVMVSFREVRPRDLRQALRERSADIALARTVGTDDPSLHQAHLRPTPASIFVASDHRLAGREHADLADFDGDRLLTASADGTPYTALLIGRFARVGASVGVVKSRVTGGAASMLTELPQTKAIAVKPACSQIPPGVTRLLVDGLTVPLVLLWPAGLPSKAALWLREALGNVNPDEAI